MKLTKYTHNPIAEIERAFDGFFNLTPVFHQLEEVYKTGDQVRFASDEKALGVQIDLPGVTMSVLFNSMKILITRLHQFKDKELKAILRLLNYLMTMKRKKKLKKL